MDKKVALITGAAKGIGRDTAIAFARKGVNVVLTDIDKTALQKTEELVKKEGVEVLSFFIQCEQRGRCKGNG